MRRAFRLVLLIAAASLAQLSLGQPALAEMRLLMVEQPGCAYCAAWDRTVAPIYPKTPEGAAAPLARVQLRGPYPYGYDLAERPIFTPTFILVENGSEVGRIDGYPGEDFFWGLLGRMLRETGHFTE